MIKRAEANDPVAMNQIGKYCSDEGDYEKAFEYYTKAAGLGNPLAHHNLSIMYRLGRGFEIDEKKEMYHLEEAAIGGHAEARFNLGYVVGKSGRYDKAIRHYIIAANQGHDGSLDNLKKSYADGYVAKDDFASALRGHKAAVDATKSPQRELAEAAKQRARQK